MFKSDRVVPFFIAGAALIAFVVFSTVMAEIEEKRDQPQLTIPTAINDIKVEWSDTITTDGKNPAYGEFNYDERRVFLRPNLGEITTLHAYYHEQCHVILWDNGLTFEDPAHEELICDAVATSRMRDILRGRK